MAALYILIPVAIVIVAIAIYVFFWAVDGASTTISTPRPQHSLSTTKTRSTRPASTKRRSRRNPRTDRVAELAPLLVSALILGLLGEATAWACAAA